MKLNLTRPLIVFDLETTGLDFIRDRIIQISYIKVSPDGTEERENLFVNPEKPIPHEVVELTGITNDDVKDAPTFKALAPQLSEKFKGCDFAGYNSNHFDIPMLAEARHCVLHAGGLAQHTPKRAAREDAECGGAIHPHP